MKIINAVSVVLGVMLASAYAGAQSIQSIEGDAHAAASASAGSINSNDSHTQTITGDSGLLTAGATADDNDPFIGGASASASGSTTWSTVYGATETTLMAQAQTTATTGDFGLSASAQGYAKLTLRFEIMATTTGTATFSDSPFGIDGSKLEYKDGANWILVADSSVAVWAGTLNAGSYRWVADQVASASGNESNSATNEFSLTAVNPVPEPSTAFVGLGILAALRKRRSRAQ